MQHIVIPVISVLPNCDGHQSTKYTPVYHGWHQRGIRIQWHTVLAAMFDSTWSIWGFPLHSQHTGWYTGIVSNSRYLGHTGFGTACCLQYCHTVWALWPPVGMFHSIFRRSPHMWQCYYYYYSALQCPALKAWQQHGGRLASYITLTASLFTGRQWWWCS